MVTIELKFKKTIKKFKELVKDTSITELNANEKIIHKEDFLKELEKRKIKITKIKDL